MINDIKNEARERMEKSLEALDPPFQQDPHGSRPSQSAGRGAGGILRRRYAAPRWREYIRGGCPYPRPDALG